MPRKPSDSFETYRAKLKAFNAYVKRVRAGDVVWPSYRMGTYRRDGKRGLPTAYMRATLDYGN